MIIRKRKVHQVGRCNFCTRNYNPEQEVYHVEGHHIGVRFCEDCMYSLRNLQELLDASVFSDKLESEGV